MRKIGLALVVLALAVGFGVPAQAGPGTTLKMPLLEGTPYIAPNGGVRVDPNDPPVAVGFVVFKGTKNRVQASVEVIDGQPNQKFTVHLVPTTNRPDWGFKGVLKTNRKGEGRINVGAKIPDGVTGAISVKITMYNNDDKVYYATDLESLDLP
ncbi:MAG: hypothetical protein ACYTGI_18830 [Planctomycetota bacterium]|jgi:hypothetical protein